MKRVREREGGERERRGGNVCSRGERGRKGWKREKERERIVYYEDRGITE